MLLGHGLQQVTTAFQVPATGKVVTQLANQYAGRTLAVVANTAPHPTDIELIPCGKQRFEQQVTVIFAARTITRAVIAAHQVKVQRRLCPRIVAVVHAQQADQLEGDGPHRHQGAEVDRPGQETL